jgi:hypothetical protein
VKKILINSLWVLTLLSCSSLDFNPDKKRDWSYLTEIPIYEVQRTGMSFMNIIDQTRKEITTYWGRNHEIFEPEAQYGDVSFYHLNAFRFALLGKPNTKISYERKLKSFEFLLIENDIRENVTREHQYKNIILHEIDAFNKNNMNFIGWNNNRDSIFSLVVGHDFKEVARYYIPISSSPITVQHFAVSESQRYIAMVYYVYPDIGGVKEVIEVYELLNKKLVKIHDLPVRPEELIREFAFSKNEQFLFLFDIKRGRIRQLALGQDLDAQIAYDPNVDYSKASASPHHLRIPNHASDILIREIYGYADKEAEKVFNEEKMELYRYNPDQGVINTYTLDITKGKYMQDGFLNDSTFIALEWDGVKDYTYHEYRFDLQNGFELKKSTPYETKDRLLNSAAYLIFDGYGRW